MLLSELCREILPPPKRVRDAVGVRQMAGTSVREFEESLAAYRLGRDFPDSILTDPGTENSLGKTRSSGIFTLLIEPNRILVTSESDLGLLYAVQALRQIVHVNELSSFTEGLSVPGIISLPCGVVEDSPDLEVRGLMIDVSRCRVPTRKTLSGLLDFMLLLRMNQLQLYTEHTFAYTAHRVIWEGSSPMTPQDVEWLHTEATGRGITLVPNQNSFGHMHRWLSHPDYLYLAEAPDGFTDPWGTFRDYPFSLSPAVPETLEFLEGLYDELLPLFDSTYFNAGCDETFDLCQGKSASLCREVGSGQVYLDYLLKINSLVQGHGKRMMFWGDIIQNHPEIIDGLPSDVLAVEWGYEGDHPFGERCERLAQSGVAFLTAPGTSSWNSITGRYDVAASNITAAVSAVMEHGGKGMLLTDWGDGGHVQQYPAFLAPIVLAASMAWNASAREVDPYRFLSRERFDDRTGNLSAALSRLGLIHQHLGPGVPNGTLFGVSLINFTIPNYQDALATHPYDEQRVRKIFDECRALVDGSSPRCPDASLLQEEIRLTIDLAELSLDLLPVHRTVTASDEIPDFVHQRLDGIENHYRAIWLERFRSGGLEESIGFLRKSERHIGGDS